jgi:hypothetical protein
MAIIPAKQNMAIQIKIKNFFTGIPYIAWQACKDQKQACLIEK